MEISKKKGLLKKPVKFTDVDAKVDVDIQPNPDLFQFYIDTNPVHRIIQVSSMTSEHEVGGNVYIRKVHSSVKSKEY